MRYTGAGFSSLVLLSLGVAKIIILITPLLLFRTSVTINVFPYHWLLGILLLKQRGIFTLCNDFSVRCVPEGETGPD